MTLGYKHKFQDGRPTLFKEKILTACYGKIVSFHTYLEPYPLEAITKMELTPKIHSIRDDEKDRWYAGLKIHHVYNNRTKERDNFLISPCVSVQAIRIIETGRVVQDEKGNDHKKGRMRSILVDGKILNQTKMEQLAVNDGFDNLEHFFTWFPLNYAGKIIHFTKLRY